MGCKGLRKIKAYMKGDERILGDSDFVETIVKACQDELDRKYLLKAGDTILIQLLIVLHKC